MHCVNCGMMPCEEDDYFCTPCLEGIPEHLKEIIPIFKELMEDTKVKIALMSPEEVRVELQARKGKVL